VDADLPRFCWGKRVLGWAAQEANNLTMAHVFMLMTSHRMTYHDIVAKGHRSTSRNCFFFNSALVFSGPFQQPIPIPQLTGCGWSVTTMVNKMIHLTLIIEIHTKHTLW
jgi:hypothetical protein